MGASGFESWPEDSLLTADLNDYPDPLNANAGMLS